MEPEGISNHWMTKVLNRAVSATTMTTTRIVERCGIHRRRRRGDDPDLALARRERRGGG